MIPRFFVSSTYYDLKYVRERLEKFIESYGFEPVLFESDKVTYQHGKEIDQSAYYEVSLCHIMVLIVGGRYGSPTVQSKIAEERKKYDDDYISITRKEFETAISKNIPIFVFIDKNVYSEYQTYKENQDFFDNLYSPTSKVSKDKKNFKFAHVDHPNVFKFIDVVRIKPIKTFEKVDEIEYYIKQQISGMFYLYLESLKKTSMDNKIIDTIAELNNITLRMNEMLTSVGKEILAKDKKEYEKVIENQFNILLDFFKEKFRDSIEIESNLKESDLNKVDIDTIARIIYEKALKYDIPKIDPGLNFEAMIVKRKEITNDVLSVLKTEISKVSDGISIKRFLFRGINHDLKNKVLPFIKGKKDEEKIIAIIKIVLKSQLAPPPF